MFPRFVAQGVKADRQPIGDHARHPQYRRNGVHDHIRLPAVKPPHGPYQLAKHRKRYGDQAGLFNNCPRGGCMFGVIVEKNA
jgi:hypothetical protein